MAVNDMSLREQRTWAIIVVFGIVLGYFALSWAGAIPDEYNIVEQYFGEGMPDSGDNTTSTTQSDSSEVEVTGIPASVNVSASSSNTYPIQFMAVEGQSGSYSIMLRPSGTNATITLSENNPLDMWHFSPDGLYAVYVGGDLLPYDYTTVTLTITGDEFTTNGDVMVICSGDGIVRANEGLISIVT